MSLWTLADAALRATALLGLCVVITLLLRHRSAALRHLVWAFGLGGALLMPLAGLLMPAAPIPVPRVLADALPALVMGTDAAGSDDVSLARGAIVAGPAGVAARGPGDRPSITPAIPPTEEPTAARPSSAGPSTGLAGLAPTGSRAATAPPTAARAPLVPGSTLLALWGLGVAAFGAWVLTGAWSTRRLARAATAVTSPEWLDALREVRRDLGIRRPVGLLRSDHTVMPMTWGWRRPVVLLPAAALGWSSERRSVVLRHELAHVKRGDAVTRLLARWTCAVYWFNPIVWFAAYRLRVEGERACDDAVLRLGTRASDYAGHLLGIARDYNAPRLCAPAAVAMARPSQLEGRLRAILDPGTRRAARRSTAVLAGAVLAGAALAVSAVAPTAQNTAPPPAPVPADGQDPAAETDTKPREPQVEPVLELRPDRADGEPGDTLIELRGDVVIAGRGFNLRLRDEGSENADGGAGGSTSAQAATIEPQRNDAGTAAGQVPAAGSALSAPQQLDPNERAAQLRRIDEALRALGSAVREAMPQQPNSDDSAVSAPSVPQQLDLDQWETHLRRAQGTLRALESAAREAMPQQPNPDGSEATIRGRFERVRVLWPLLAGIREPDSETLNRIEAVRRARRQARRELDSRLTDTLIGALGDADAEVRERAARALGRHRVPEGAEALRAALRDGDPAVREGAAWALGRIGDDGAAAALLDALRDPEPEVRAGAASALGMLESPAAVDELAAALDDPDVRVRDRTARALGRTRDRIATGASGATESAALEVIEGFRRTGGDLALEALIRLMDASDPELRRAAIAALSGGRWLSSGETPETPQAPDGAVNAPSR